MEATGNAPTLVSGPALRHDVRVLLQHEIHYDASPDEVFEMLADPEFRTAVCEAQQVVSQDVTIERQGDGFRLVCDQVQRTAGLPSFAKKFAGDTTRAIQREDWADSSGGDLEIDTPGKPSHLSGTITLEPTDTGTVETVELEVKVKVPLIGGKLEGLLVDVVTAALKVENRVGVAWLAGER